MVTTPLSRSEAQVGHAAVAGRMNASGVMSLRLAALVLAFITGLLVVDAMVQPVAPFDVWVMNTIQRLDFAGLATILTGFSHLTSTIGAVTMWFAMLFVFIVSRRWLPALVVLALPIGGLINNVVGEYLVGRTRPDDTEYSLTRSIAEIDAASFPSGHVMGAVMLYGLLFFVAMGWHNRIVAFAVQTASVAIISITGVARVWEGAHWPSDVLGAYALGGLLLVGIIAAYRRIDLAVGDVPFVKAALVPHDESRPHAHALTSTVFFNKDSVSKVYAPGFVPRALYWLSYQAEFPYIRNIAALRAARERRNLAAMLTEYWYGERRVALMVGIDNVDGRQALSSEFIDGGTPVDKRSAKRFLHDLRSKFEDAGLPTWQIDPRQPRAIDNVLETPEGDYFIVDLESGLVSPLASIKTWWRAIRRGMVPIFDDVYFDVTRDYLECETAGMRTQMGDAWLLNSTRRSTGPRPRCWPGTQASHASGAGSCADFGPVSESAPGAREYEPG